MYSVYKTNTTNREWMWCQLMCLIYETDDRILIEFSIELYLPISFLFCYKGEGVNLISTKK